MRFVSRFVFCRSWLVLRFWLFWFLSSVVWFGLIWFCWMVVVR